VDDLGCYPADASLPAVCEASVYHAVRLPVDHVAEISDHDAETALITMAETRRSRCPESVITMAEFRTLANCVPFRAGEFGFTVDCVAQCENLLSIDQAQLELGGGPRGVIDSAALSKVVKAIGYVIDSTCEPL
jgi:hypothetical protein